MEITIEKKNYNNELSDDERKMTYFIQEYLENSYKIKKQGTVYLLKKKTNKIIIDESTIHKMYKLNSISTKQQNIYITRFLLKSLRNNWSIEKKQNNYILSKKHHGKKEYYSPEFLTEFMENNF